MAEQAKETKEVVVEKEGTEEEIDLDFNIEDLPDDASQEDKDKAIKTLTAQKAHWRKKFEEASKKPEKDEVKTEKKDEVKTEANLSQSDLITLTRSDIHEDDIPEVLEYAKLKGVSVKEALTSNVVQAILETNKEKRTVADATNTGKTAKTVTGTSDDELLANAKKGIMPESEEDMNRLAKLRLGL